MIFPSKTPRVSVIIPCYNTSRFIAQTVESVFAQIYRDFEVVIVNDGSPDTPQLEQALAPWAERIVYVKTENHGVAEARNVGIRAAKGDFVALLDSDDVWELNFLDVQVRKLDEDPTADIVYPRLISFWEGSRSGARSVVPRSPVTFISIIQETCHVSCSVVARRAAFERVGLFDSSLRSSEDYDMWLRCVKSGSRIIYNDKALLLYRRRPDSLSADPVLICDTTVKVLVKMRTAVQTTAEERQVLENAIRRIEGNRLFFEGKDAFIAGDISNAVDRLRRANALLHKIRLRMILLIVRTMPQLARTVYLWRLHFGSGAHSGNARFHIKDGTHSQL